MPEPHRTSEREQRWRLLLGEGSEELGQLSLKLARQERALSFLYDRELGAGRNTRPSGGSRSGDLGESQLTVPHWINEVHELFPREVVDRLEEDALNRYGLVELVTRKDILEQVEPSEALLKAVLMTKHLMNAEVLSAARALVRKVVHQLIERLRREIETSFTGVRNPRKRSRIKRAANFDASATLRANLRHYDPERRQVVIAEPLFVSRTHHHIARWQVIMVVDQSGSMVDSVIHSAVTASVFHGIGQLKSHLVAFDTAVVDLTHDALDPVETLMKVQLGGGTDIGKALRYAEQIVDSPARAMVVLVSDLYEGGDPGVLLGTVERLLASGVRVLILGALDPQGVGDYDQAMAQRLLDLGAKVGVMTPYQLADWVAEVLT